MVSRNCHVKTHKLLNKVDIDSRQIYAGYHARVACTAITHYNNAN